MSAGISLFSDAIMRFRPHDVENDCTLDPDAYVDALLYCPNSSFSLFTCLTFHVCLVAFRPGASCCALFCPRASYSLLFVTSHTSTVLDHLSGVDWV